VKISSILFKVENLKAKDISLLTMGLVNVKKSNHLFDTLDSLFLEYLFPEGIGKRIMKVIYYPPVEDFSRALQNLFCFLSSSQIFPFDFTVARIITKKVVPHNTGWMTIAHETYRKVIPSVLKENISKCSYISIDVDTFIALLMGVHRLSTSLKVAIFNQYLSLLLLRINEDERERYLSNVFAIIISFIEVLINSYYKLTALPGESAYSILHDTIFKYCDELEDIDSRFGYIDELFRKLLNLTKDADFDIKQYMNVVEKLFPEEELIGYYQRNSESVNRFKLLIYNDFIKQILRRLSEDKNDNIRLNPAITSLNNFFCDLQNILIGGFSVFISFLNRPNHDLNIGTISKIVVPVVVTEQFSLANILAILEFIHSILKIKKTVDVVIIAYYSPLTYINRLILENKLNELKPKIEAKFSNIKLNVKYYIVSANQIYYNSLLFEASIKEEINGTVGLIKIPLGSGPQYIALRDAINRLSKHLIILNS